MSNSSNEKQCEENKLFSLHCGEKDEDLLLSLKYNFHLCLSNARVIVKEVGTVVSNSYVLVNKINVTKTGTYFLSHSFWYNNF